MSDRVSSYSGMSQMDSLIDAMTSQLNGMVNEVASGEVTNPAQTMGTSASLLYQLQAQSTQETTLQTSIGVASQQLDTVQAVMGSIGSLAQSVSDAGMQAQEDGTGTISGSSATLLAEQAQTAMEQVLGQLNTTYAGSALFAGDSTNPPMQSLDATGGPTDTMNSILSAAVTANGGTPLSASDIDNLVNGPNGIASVFNGTNSNPAENFNGVFYTGSASPQQTTVLIGTNQTVQYNTQANQPAFTDLLQGLSMISLAGSSSSQLDSSGQNQLLTDGLQLLNNAQTELTNMQGGLGDIQSQMQNAVNLQQSAATATQQQINGYVQANTTADSTDITALQTQLQAAYELTAQISQLSLTHYMPSPA